MVLINALQPLLLDNEELKCIIQTFTGKRTQVLTRFKGHSHIHCKVWVMHFSPSVSSGSNILEVHLLESCAHKTLEVYIGQIQCAAQDVLLQCMTGCNT